MRYIISILFIFCCTALWAEEAAFENLSLAKAPVDLTNIESIKRGAKFFATNCMSCHTMIYLQYDKIAKEAGITIDKMPINVKDWPYGVKPPDLSNEVAVRGADWIYTYLHSFYLDTSRPTGVNNLLLPNTAMPDIVAPYQGQQVLIKDKPSAGVLFNDIQWYDVLVLVKQGTMTPEEFDATIADLANFMAYAADPYTVERYQIGWWVIGFLIIMVLLSYKLKKEYWKDVKRRKFE